MRTKWTIDPTNSAPIAQKPGQGIGGIDNFTIQSKVNAVFKVKMNLVNVYLRSPRTLRVLNRKPNEAGFSLIELVVVVAVLAILSAIAIPTFQNINNTARAAAASNTLAQLVKECAVKHATGQTGTALNHATIALNGYATLPGAACPTTGTLQLSVDPTNANLPQFTYTYATGAKTCTPNVQNCRGGSW